jgi:hypothetical protein
MGIKLGQAADAVMPAFNEETALINALAIGRFGAADVDAALAKDFVGEATVRPVSGAEAAGMRWNAVNSPSRDRFMLQELRQGGPEDGAFAVYFSYWIRSPRALDDLLADGPDAPRFSSLFYVSEKCRLFVNGGEVQPARTQAADYRTLYVFENIPLTKNWNHFLVKVAAKELRGERPATLAARIGSTNGDFLRQLESAVELKAQAGTGK